MRSNRVVKWLRRIARGESYARQDTRARHRPGRESRNRRGSPAAVDGAPAAEKRAAALRLHARKAVHGGQAGRFLRLTIAFPSLAEARSGAIATGC